MLVLNNFNFLHLDCNYVMIYYTQITNSIPLEDINSIINCT